MLTFDQPGIVLRLHAISLKSNFQKNCCSFFLIGRFKAPSNLVHRVVSEPLCQSQKTTLVLAVVCDGDF